VLVLTVKCHAYVPKPLGIRKGDDHANAGFINPAFRAYELIWATTLHKNKVLKIWGFVVYECALVCFNHDPFV